MSKVKIENQDHISIITINRPDKKNAIDNETALLLFKAFEEFDRDENQYVAILTGSNGVFCSGADLDAISANSFDIPNVTLEEMAPLGVSRMRLSKPVIAAVEGYAVAGGLELAIWCDIRVAAEDAIFGVYCRRLGVPLVDGGTVRLPRLIGHSQAMDMILTGRNVEGQEGLDIGLSNRLVPKGKTLEYAMDLAGVLCAFPQTCMRSDRLSVFEQWGLSENEALINETRRGLKVIESGETLEGARRFSSKKT